MSEALRLADGLRNIAADTSMSESYCQILLDADDELRRLAAVEAQWDELLVALRRIAMASEATVCNQDWVVKTARAAIAKAEQEN